MVKIKVALYARVSTEDQDPTMQEKALKNRAVREEWEWEYYEEKESTRKTRPIKYALYQRLLNREYDAVCVWKIDRWARSVKELTTEIEILYNRGVKFISIIDPIDLSTDTGWLQFQIISAFAEFERRIISTRTKEGLKHAKNVGKRGKDQNPRRKSGYLLRYAKKGGL